MLQLDRVTLDHWQNLSLIEIEEKINGVLRVEEWKDIKGYEGRYQASTFGRIKSLGNGKNCPIKIMKLSLKKNGYLHCVLWRNLIDSTKRVHILIASTFIPNPNNKPEVNHKKGIKTDNRVWSLEWNTRSENSKHAHKLGLIIPSKSWLGKCGKLHVRSKEVIQYDLSGNEVGRYFGTEEASRATRANQQNISAVCNGKRQSAGGYKWKYV